VEDSVIQAILRHSDVSVTQRCYIKTNHPDAVAAMRQLSAKMSESAETLQLFSVLFSATG